MRLPVVLTKRNKRRRPFSLPSAMLESILDDTPEEKRDLQLPFLYFNKGVVESEELNLLLGIG